MGIVNIDIEKTYIYVIFGQQEALKREIFAFLRTIGMEPLDWQNAARLLHKGAPLIKKVVAAGLEVAQVILVVRVACDELSQQEILSNDQSKVIVSNGQFLSLAFELSTSYHKFFPCLTR